MSNITTMQDELKKVAASLDAAQQVVDQAMRSASRHEILELTDTLYVVDWRDRSETPPPGMIWASDGNAIWTLRSFGEPIPATAIAVKFWTVALIPKPPLMPAE